MRIEELSGERLDDWFEFFEQRAFEDHAEWKGCYCTAFFYPKPEEYPGLTNKRKDFAAWLVQTGRMRGYLAYEGAKVVGWVNANTKKHFPRLNGPAGGEETVLSVVCFLVQKEHRGKGIAKGLLQRIVADAQTRGYGAVEAYPKKGAQSEYGRWNGPFGMYQAAGFVEVVRDKTKVVRLSLGPGPAPGDGHHEN